jgi:hypothetical protein
MGCLPHLRALIGEAQLKAESVVIKENFPDHAVHERMEPDCNKLIFAIQKYIGVGYQLAGRRDQFEEFIKLHQLVCPKLYLGRAGNGSRQDHGFEVGSKIAMMMMTIVKFCCSDDVAGTKTVLSTSVKIRLSDQIFAVVLIHRHLWWTKCYSMALECKRLI